MVVVAVPIIARPRSATQVRVGDRICVSRDCPVADVERVEHTTYNGRLAVLLLLNYGLGTCVETYLETSHTVWKLHS